MHCQRPLKEKIVEGLQGDQYTIWWVIFPPGEGPGTADPSAIIWANGFIANEDGEYEGTVKLRKGADGIADLPDGAFHEGMLTDPFSEAVENEFVYHGQGDDPDFEDQWLLDFFTGDDDVCDVFLGTPDDPLCPLAQITFHETPSGSSGDDDDDDDDDD